MKGLSCSFLRIAYALAIGLILVLFPHQAGEYLVITIGFVFLIPSIIGIVSYFTQQKKDERHFPIEGIGSLLFGAWLMIVPVFFVNLLTYLLGFILLIGGVQQIASLISARRWASVSTGFYIVPSLILLAGLISLFNPTGVQATVFIIIGSASLVYAVSELVNWFKFMRLRPKAKVNDSSQESKTVTDNKEDQLIEDA